METLFSFPNIFVCNKSSHRRSRFGWHCGERERNFATATPLQLDPRWQGLGLRYHQRPSWGLAVIQIPLVENHCHRSVSIFAKFLDQLKPSKFAAVISISCYGPFTAVGNNRVKTASGSKHCPAGENIWPGTRQLCEPRNKSKHQLSQVKNTALRGWANACWVSRLCTAAVALNISACRRKRDSGNKLFIARMQVLLQHRPPANLFRNNNMEGEAGCGRCSISKPEWRLGNA